MSTVTEPKVILACDPGYDRLGVAVITGSVHKNELLFSTCLLTDKKEDIATRLGYLYVELRKIIEKYSPNAIAVEKLFFSNNKTSALAVAESRGMILALAGSMNIPVIEHSPADVKIAVTGYGNATKKDVIMMTKKLISGIDEKALDDEYDAVALSICALASYKK
ncbi:MAG: crossover junction endodeoxyribonuclease RuvC [Patescibacteria group bacterium UBA2103]